MQAVKAAVASTLLGALVVLGAGCGGSSPEAAKTPSNAVTVTNGQTSEATTTAEGGGGASDQVASGKAIFEKTCQGCHTAGGTVAGVGPKLEGIGWSPAQITHQIEHPRAVMPPNLVSGQDLTDVVAYVSSLQKGTSGGGAAPAPAPTKPTTKPAPPQKPNTVSTQAPATTTAQKPAAEGDVAAGKAFFESTCQGCHPAGGTTAGVGPQLKGIGWSTEQITHQIEHPRQAMPPGLASGQDLKNVVAYVESLQ